MGFIIILILTTLAIAITAASFSIYGLAAIFSGAFWSVVLMGFALETGKLVAVSYLYRFRDSISNIMKIYLISAIIVLMLICSAGIFGFLSLAYQQDILPLKQQEQQIKLLTSEKIEIEAFKGERLERRKQIDADIASLPNNYITARQRLMKSYGPELVQLRLDIKLYTNQIKEKTLEISELKQKKLINEVHVGPIIFIAKAFSTATDDATKWMIILIMFAFDPLAVALTIGVNHALQIRKKEKEIENNNKTDEHIILDGKKKKVSKTKDSKPTKVKPISDIDVERLKVAMKEMQNQNLSSEEMACKTKEILEKNEEIK